MLEGFSLARKDGRWVWAAIVNNSVVLQSKDVPAPTAVRYGIDNRPLGNLYTKDGMPAAPFAADVKYL